MKNVQIEHRRIGVNYPTYIIAEIGGNFSTLKQGMNLINAAVRSGADAVKIQTFRAEKIASKYATFDMPGIGGKRKQLDIMRQLELDYTVQRKLFKYAKKKNVTIFSTPSHKSDIDFLEDNDVCAYKIGSDDLTNIPLIKEVGRINKPTIISTGMSNLNEVRDAVNAFYSTGNKKLILLHCVSMYPFDPKFANLNAIATLQRMFKIPVGWSDHTTDVDLCVAAASLGANVIEKHFTLDKKLKGPDHVLSATPNEFSRMSKVIKIIEKARGNGVKKAAICERGTIRDIRKSVVAKHDIPKGRRITIDMLEIKRPGYGIPPKMLNHIVGRITKREIPQDKPILFTDIRR